jgi:hypothetical protein
MKKLRKFLEVEGVLIQADELELIRHHPTKSKVTFIYQNGRKVTVDTGWYAGCMTLIPYWLSYDEDELLDDEWDGTIDLTDILLI